MIAYIQINSRRYPKPGQSWTSYPGAKTQMAVLTDAAASRDCKILDHTVSRRGNPNASPLSDPYFLRAIDKAREAGVPIVVTDVFELVAAMEIKAAMKVLLDLAKLDVGILSAIHGVELSGIPPKLWATNLKYHLYKSMERSARVKHGLAKNRNGKSARTAKPPRRTGKKGNAVASAKADAFAREIAPKIDAIINTLSAKQKESKRAIARALNDNQVPSPRGGLWSDIQVRRTLKRIERLNSTK